MAVEFRKGDRVYSPRFGRGEILAVWEGRMTLRFEDGSELKVQDPAAIRLERIEAAPPAAAGPAPDPVAGPVRGEEASMETDPLRRLIREALEDVLGPAHARIGERWKGGKIVLRPGRAGTQEKEVSIEAFFQKIVRVRDQLRVLEQKVNAHPALSAEDKITLQQYVTRCYGSLTTFNVLFHDPEDRFVGGGGA
ncbi:MAG: hypothetical protein PVF68_13255 [Acidobacteriota bacterium]|jgi:hypothetical protein